MREPKPEWLMRLRALDSGADLRFNTAVNRWEFILTSADGVPRSQFWCQFDATRRERITDPVTGKTYEQDVPDRDPLTGMMPFRELNDGQMAIALGNLERSFVGNPHDGAGSVRRDVLQRYRFNRDLQERKFQQQGKEYADFIWEHRRQIRDGGAGPLVSVSKEIR